MFFGIALIASVAGALISTRTLMAINRNIAAAKEAARPAAVKIIKITVPNCQDCFDVEAVVSSFKKQNVKVEEENTLPYDSPQASASALQFGIKKVPTYLVTGEITKNNLENFVKNSGEIKNDTFIFTKTTPIFIDMQTGQEMGRVTATVITDSSCLQCPDPQVIIDNFKKAGVKVGETKHYAWNSYDGQATINQYKITKVPTFIFSSEIDLYESVKSTWQNFGTIENNKTYVARNLPLPYRDLINGQLTGLVDLIYLTDSTCPDCYKVVDVQKPILTNGYKVALRSERSVDIGSPEGRSLVNQYSITKAPTILLSPEADKYPNLKSIWNSVGTVGSDGWYVFTGFNLLGNITYKDLANNQVIKPAQQTQTTK